MIYRPTIRQLSFLVALHEHKNFSRAAEAQNVTQSTLSAGIQDLESLLGTPLVERTKRMVRFTRLGEDVVKRAHEILKGTDDLVAVVRAAAGPLQGEVRLGAIPTIAPFVLPQALPELRKKFPNLRLYLKEGQTEDTLDGLRKGDIDVGLIAFPYLTPGLSVEIMWEEKFYLVMPEDHPLASRKSISISDIDQSQLLLLEEGHCLSDHAMSVCELNDLKAGEQFKATSLETLVLMVSVGLGMTLVPEMAIKAGLLEGKGLKARQITGVSGGRKIGLCWRGSNPRTEEFKLLAQEIKRP